MFMSNWIKCFKTKDVSQNVTFYFVEPFYFDEFGDSLHQKWNADKITVNQYQTLHRSMKSLVIVIDHSDFAKYDFDLTKGSDN